MPAHRNAITEAQAERMADMAVADRLATDRAYRNAEDADAQAMREQAIADEVWARITRDYQII